MFMGTVRLLSVRKGERAKNRPGGAPIALNRNSFGDTLGPLGANPEFHE